MLMIGDREIIKLCGQRMNKVRSDRGYSLEDVAKLVDTSRQTILNMEKGVGKSIDYERLKKVAKVLQCSTSYLLGYTRNPEEVILEDNPDKVLIDPIITVLPPLHGVNRLIDICHKKPPMLDKIAAFLDTLNPEQQTVFGDFMDFFTRFGGLLNTLTPEQKNVIEDFVAFFPRFANFFEIVNPKQEKAYQEFMDFFERFTKS